MALLPDKVDVLVVGSGNAGLSAAISAAETFPPASPSSPSSARRVLLVDACPEAWFGGNTYFTAGAFRAAHAGLADLLPLVNNVSGDEHARRIDLEPYPTTAFARDLERVCLGRSDPELARVLVDDSNDAVKWLAGHGVRFQLSFNRQAYEVDGRIRFWGGLALKTQDGGKGLVQDLRRAASSLGVQIACSAAVKNLLVDDDDGGTVRGAVIVTPDGARHVVRAPSVVMAAGGFEANPRLRSQYLGPGWDMAKVRGTPHNTGLCLEACLREPVLAKPAGNWSGCHSVAWDADAPSDGGDRATSNEFTKSGYPLGLMVNLEGERFVDEGLDLRNFTYAVFGRAILAQPGRAAFQVWGREDGVMAAGRGVPRRRRRQDPGLFPRGTGAEVRRKGPQGPAEVRPHHHGIQRGRGAVRRGEPPSQVGPSSQGRRFDAIVQEKPTPGKVQLGPAP